jgi:hypothetical protein
MKYSPLGPAAMCWTHRNISNTWQQNILLATQSANELYSGHCADCHKHTTELNLCNLLTLNALSHITLPYNSHTAHERQRRRGQHHLPQHCLTAHHSTLHLTLR